MASFFKRFLFEEEDNPRVRTQTRVQAQARTTMRTTTLIKPIITTPLHPFESLKTIKEKETGREREKEEEVKKPDFVKNSVKGAVKNDLKNITSDDCKDADNVKVISITKAKKKQSGWNEHVAKYKREHPELNGSELFKQAKKQYNKNLKK